MGRNILFLCTGNYYRSRFAELLFNARASAQGVPWRAVSRGLAIEKGINNAGPISPNAIAALAALGIRLPDAHRYPLQAEERDFRVADLIIALKRDEHEPYIRARHAAWAERVQYWHVHDRIPNRDYDPLRVIAGEVQELIRHLDHGKA